MLKTPGTQKATDMICLDSEKSEFYIFIEGGCKETEFLYIPVLLY